MVRPHFSGAITHHRIVHAGPDVYNHSVVSAAFLLVDNELLGWAIKCSQGISIRFLGLANILLRDGFSNLLSVLQVVND